MSYIELINAFERWLETNYLPISSQLLWYKLISLFNSCGWSEWVTVDNQRLMSIMQLKNEKTFIKCRDKLVQANLFEYRRGKKGSPNQYKINTVNFTVENKNTVKNTVHSTVQSTVFPTVKSTDINRLDKDIYINLFNKYIKRIKQEPKRVVQIISEMQNSSDYQLLTLEQQKQIFFDLINPENRRI